MDNLPDEEDPIGLIGVCPACLTPGITEFICEDNHVHTMPFSSDPNSLNGLKQIQFVFETIEQLIPDCILSDSGKEKVRRAIEAEKVALKLKIKQVEN